MGRKSKNYTEDYPELDGINNLVPKQRTEISDEEIMEAIDELNTDGQSPSWEYGFYDGAKWYREQLKKL